jgi:phosphatidate cytidylyltransferase
MTGILTGTGASRPSFLPLIALVFVFLLFLNAILRYGKDSAVPFSDLTAALFAGLVFPLMLGCLLRMRLLPYGEVLVWVPLVIAFGSDTFALFAGMTLGKHKMAPLVSPHKTVEGGIGGLLGGVIGLLVLKWIALAAAGVVFLSYGRLIALGLTGAAIGEIGDLSFSVIKREFGVKDYGKLLPGHGGVLDRFDSVTFVAPFAYLVCTLLWA